MPTITPFSECEGLEAPSSRSLPLSCHDAAADRPCLMTDADAPPLLGGRRARGAVGAGAALLERGASALESRVAAGGVAAGGSLRREPLLALTQEPPDL